MSYTSVPIVELPSAATINSIASLSSSNKGDAGFEFNTSTLLQLLISKVEYSLLLCTLVKNNDTNTPSTSILFSNTDSR